ncbi:MAG: cation transporter [Burkholderiaceae bacterium]|nr:MAG: cation transporter [Burkholderiaceae bacterium]
MTEIDRRLHVRSGSAERQQDVQHHAHHRHEHGDAAHPHHYQPRSRRALFLALLLTAGFGVVEFAGGLWANSLALLSDAGHMATDAASLLLACIALLFVNRPASRQLSFGYLRAEVLAAFVNALAMATLIGVIVWEAIHRMFAPHTVAGFTVTTIAAVGLLVNLLVLWVLRDPDAPAHELNRRVATLHVMGDLFGSVAAVVAGVVIQTTGWMLIDPLLSLFVCALLAKSTWNLLRESALVLMEGVPQHIDYDAVGDALQEIAGVTNVHDLHIWSMAPGQPALSAHIKVADMQQWVEILEASRAMLRQRFNIDHMTLQPEAAEASREGP